MGVYWQAQSYKKDNSYILSEIKTRGFYGVNYALTNPFKTNKFVQFRHGVDLFHKAAKSQYVLEEYGLGMREDDFFFYLNADDGIDGTTLKFVNDDEILGLFFDPSKPLLTVEALANFTDNFNEFENKKELEELLELLKDAKENDHLVHFLWTE